MSDVKVVSLSDMLQTWLCSIFNTGKTAETET